MKPRETTQFTHLFTPIRVGRMDLPNRIMATPHATPIGNLWSPDEAEADRNIAYWAARARAGLAWVGGISAALENHLVPGFEPTGVGAAARGVFRLPYFHDRIRKLTDTLHEAGAYVTAQLIMQGGMPHGPSPTVTAYVANQVSHALDRDEIAWFINEYAESARRGKAAGLDGVELHANHDDLLEWFLSPASNHRDDEYGGDLAGRMRFLLEIIDAIRAEVGPDFTLGVRMNLYEALDGGYDAAEGVDIAKALEATGKIDYLSVVVGDNWGAPSYIQPHYYQPAQWADLAAQVTRAVSLPVIYTGRVTDPHTAEKVIAQGQADLVGMARAIITDPEIITKTGKINLDFEDVKTTLKQGGAAIISNGYGEGDNRVEKAITDALNSPLLKECDVYSSKRLLFNLYFSSKTENELTAKEISQLSDFTSNIKDVEIIWGTAYDDSLGDKVKITILASGFDVSVDEVPSQESRPSRFGVGRTRRPETAAATVDTKIADIYGDSTIFNTMVIDPSNYDNDEIIESFESSPTLTRKNSELKQSAAPKPAPAPEQEAAPENNSGQTGIPFGEAN